MSRRKDYVVVPACDRRVNYLTSSLVRTAAPQQLLLQTVHAYARHPPQTMVPPASRASILRLLSVTANQGCRGCGRTHSAVHHPSTPVINGSQSSGRALGVRGMATPIGGFRSDPPPGDGDYAFEASLALETRIHPAHTTLRWLLQTFVSELMRPAKSAWTFPI